MDTEAVPFKYEPKETQHDPNGKKNQVFAVNRIKIKHECRSDVAMFVNEPDGTTVLFDPRFNDDWSEQGLLFPTILCKVTDKTIFVPVL